MDPPVSRTFGKSVRGTLYFHIAALDELDNQLRKTVRLAARQAGLDMETGFNVVKLDREGSQISLFCYDQFFDNPFPALNRSYIVDLASGQVKRVSYERSANPPILYRKELLLPADHPQVPAFQALTRQLEAAGLFRDSRQIGFVREWQKRLRAAGYEVRGHQLTALNGASRAEERTQKTSPGTGQQSAALHSRLPYRHLDATGISMAHGPSSITDAAGGET